MSILNVEKLSHGFGDEPFSQTFLSACSKGNMLALSVPTAKENPHL